jgi:hypothetical protein
VFPNSRVNFVVKLYPLNNEMNVCKNMKLEVLKTLDYPKLSFEEFHYSISQDQYYIVDHVPIISKVFKTIIVF